MNRIYINTLGEHKGVEVTIAGWIDVRRDQGKMVFFDFRDMTGKVQGVVLPGSAAIEIAKECRSEWVVRVKGKVNARPERAVQKDKQNGDIELEVLEIEVLSKVEEIPFELNAELNIDTHFDYLPYTLRSEKSKDVFKVQATILDTFRQSLRRQQFTEFQAPAIVGGDAEGGAAAFKVEYFGDHSAFLATSGQLYKQIMVGAFERAMTIAKTFRAEKSATTRHLAEITQMEFEMGFINDHTEVMAMLEQVMRDIVSEVIEKHADVFARFGTTAPKVGTKFPVLTLLEAQQIIEKEFPGTKAVGELDMEPEHERQICEWAAREHDCDFVFITHFPTKKRAFYTFADPENPELSRSFDLIFRGLEINSGSQRIHTYHELVEKMRSKGMDDSKFSFYLQSFKYGMPPHGGCSTGLERITARMLNLPNVKYAAAFPRDMHRIDNRLTE